MPYLGFRVLNNQLEVGVVFPFSANFSIEPLFGKLLLLKYIFKFCCFIFESLAFFFQRTNLREFLLSFNILGLKFLYSLSQGLVFLLFFFNSRIQKTYLFCQVDGLIFQIGDLVISSFVVFFALLFHLLK